MEFVEESVEIAVVACFLMGIFAVAEAHGAVDGHTESRIFTGCQRCGSGKPVVDGRVVAARHCESFAGEETALLLGRCCALSVENALKIGIELRRGHDCGVGEVLCSRTDKRDTAYIYFFDDIGFARAGSDSGFEGVEVDDNEVDAGNFIFFHLGYVAFVGAASEDAAEHLGMEGLDATSED